MSFCYRKHGWSQLASVVVALLGLVPVLMCVTSANVVAQRIVDTSPRFASDTASATAGPGASVPNGGGYAVGGFPYGYTVRLAGQNTNYPFSAYGTPRQYGAHDHGFAHVRHPDQARFNQYGRNHWVVNPIVTCPPIWGPPICGTPICGPYRPNCYPYGYSNGYPYCFPTCYRPPVYCGIPWGWNRWYGSGFGGFGGFVGFGGAWGNGGFAQGNGFGALQGQGFFAGQGMMAAPGFGGLAPDAWSADVLARPEASALAPIEVPFAPGVVADRLIQRRAADVMAQHRAIAALEAAGSRSRQQAVVSGVDPLGQATIQETNQTVVSKDGRVYSASKGAKSMEKDKPKSAIERSAAESLNARRAAQAEAERQRLLDTLRQK